MKRFFVSLFLLCSLVVFSQVQTVHINPFDIEWNAVTTLENGDPIPVGDIISYEVIIAPKSDLTDITILGNALDGDGYTVLIPMEGKYNVGVRTSRYVSAWDEFTFSAPNWSHELEGTPVPFDALYLFAPSVADGLGVK